MLDRATASHVCMLKLAGVFDWETITAADYGLELEAARALMATAAAERASEAAAAGELNAQLLDLRKKMRLGVSLAKKKWSADATSLGVLRGLRTNSNARLGTLQQALRWEKAWLKLDAAWVPVAGNTYGAFCLLRAACQAAVETDATEETGDAQASGELAVAVRRLYDLSVAWFGEALIRFPADTALGMMLRAEVPTRKSPRPQQAVVTGEYQAEGARIVLTFEARGGRAFTIARRGPGEKEFTVLSKKQPAKTFADVTAEKGENVYVVTPYNSRGKGPVSEEVRVVKG